MTTYDQPFPTGAPAWVDLATSDREASWAFYSAVLGWEVEDTGEQTHHYGLARLGGSVVAGIWQPPEEQRGPVAWVTYLATPDAKATAAAIEENGGRLIFPPIEVPFQGWMALAADPTGGVFGIWQALGRVGYERANEPGTVVWNELLTRDTAAARDFYGKVFGLTFTALPGVDIDYTTIDGEGPGNTCGGLGGLGDDVPPQVPAHWMTYFAVADADTTAAKITELGGTVLSGPYDSQFGRMAVVEDPQGGRFSLIGAAADPQQGG